MPLASVARFKRCAACFYLMRTVSALLAIAEIILCMRPTTVIAVQRTFSVSAAFGGADSERIWRVLDRGCKHEIKNIHLEYDV